MIVFLICSKPSGDFFFEQRNLLTALQGHSVCPHRVFLTSCLATFAVLISLSFVNFIHTELLMIASDYHHILGIFSSRYIHLSFSPCQIHPWPNLNAYFCFHFLDLILYPQTHIALVAEGLTAWVCLAKSWFCHLLAI